MALLGNSGGFGQKETVLKAYVANKYVVNAALQRSGELLAPVLWFWMKEL